MTTWNKNVEKLLFNLLVKDQKMYSEFEELLEKMEQAYVFLENGGKVPKVTGEYEKWGLKIGLRDELIENLNYNRTYISLLLECGEEGFHNETIADYSGREYTEADREYFKKKREVLDRFFEIIKPNILTPWLIREAAYFPYEIFSLITVYFCILGRLVDYTRITLPYKNPHLRMFPPLNVSKQVENALLKDSKIEELFELIFKEVNASTLPNLKGERVVPVLFDSIRKNMFPKIKINKSQHKLPFMNYLYLQAEEKQPLAVLEVKKKKIDVKNLVDLEQAKNKEIVSHMGKEEILVEFLLILLDIVFSQKLQDLLKKYEFYHKFLVDLAYNGNFEQLEKKVNLQNEEEIPYKEVRKNPNSKIKGVWKIGFYLYKLYLYLGIYKSLIGYKEFYYKKDFYSCHNPDYPQRQSYQLAYGEKRGFMDPAIEVISRYFDFIKAMDDFSFELNFFLDKIPEDGVLKAKIYSFKSEKEEGLLLEEGAKKEREVQEVEWDVKEILEGYKKRKMQENMNQ